jgi:hypothetical protein
MEKVNQKRSKENGTDFSEIPCQMYFINFKILSNITRPSFTAIKIVEKLSSSRTMSAASLEMAVPLIPIAIPMLALLGEHHLHHHRS